MRKRLDEAERGNARGAQPQAWQVRSQERTDPTLAERRHGTRGPASARAAARVAVARTYAALPVEAEVTWGVPLPAASLTRETEKRSPSSSRSRFAPTSGVVAGRGTVRHARAHRSGRCRRCRGCSRTRGLSVLVSDRDLRPSPSVAVGTATVVDARLRGRAGHVGGQRQALRSLVRTAGRLPSATASPRRRDERFTLAARKARVPAAGSGFARPL